MRRCAAGPKLEMEGMMAETESALLPSGRVPISSRKPLKCWGFYEVLHL